MARPAIDLTGAKSHWLEVVHRAGSDGRGNALWRCRCHGCGEDFTITGNSFRSGSQRSCGCMRRVRPLPEPPFPAYRRQPAGTTLTTRERAKREEAAAGAAGVALEPPGPDDVCAYRPTDWSRGGRSQPVPACGRPSAYAGFGLCPAHASTARDSGASSYVHHSADLVALDMAAEITGGCAACGETWTVRAGEAARRFREHLPRCTGSPDNP
jgi:hypothetical protein